MSENGVAIKRSLLRFYGVFCGRIADSVRPLARVFIYADGTDLLPTAVRDFSFSLPSDNFRARSVHFTVTFTL